MKTKTYYKAPVMIAEFQNIKLATNGDIKYDRKNIVIEEDVEFYFNFLAVLIRKDNKFPVTLEEEVDDLFINDVLSIKGEVPSTLRYQYVNPLELTVIKNKTDKPKQKVKLFSTEQSN